MQATSVGLWLVVVGALAAVGGTLLDVPSRGTGGLRFESPERAQPERLRHAIEVAALTFIAIGSIIVAVAEVPRFWLVLVTLAAFGAIVWLVGA